MAHFFLVVVHTTYVVHVRPTLYKLIEATGCQSMDCPKGYINDKQSDINS